MLQGITSFTILTYCCKVSLVSRFTIPYLLLLIMSCRFINTVYVLWKRIYLWMHWCNIDIVFSYFCVQIQARMRNLYGWLYSKCSLHYKPELCMYDMAQTPLFPVMVSCNTGRVAIFLLMLLWDFLAVCSFKLLSLCTALTNGAICLDGFR